MHFRLQITPALVYTKCSAHTHTCVCMCATYKRMYHARVCMYICMYLCVCVCVHVAFYLGLLHSVFFEQKHIRNALGAH
jgi:hypothetical protein